MAQKETQIQEAARLFSILGEPSRLKILHLLREGARCGRELARELKLTPATTCHHLDRLKLANLLEERRSGKHVYYSVIDSELSRAIEQSLQTLQDTPIQGGKVKRGRESRLREARE